MPVPDDRSPDPVDDGRAPDRSGDGPAAERDEPLSLHAQLRDAVARAGIAQVAPGEAPSGAALLTAVGGIRGLAESILPGFAFLVVFAITKELVPSVVVPVLVALVFVAVRVAQRQSLATALIGIVGVAISAGLALVTGRAETNFIPGIVINAVCLLALLVSLAVRRPLIGVVVGLLLPAPEPGSGVPDRRDDAAVRRVLAVATWLWAGLFALRLVIEVPLYLAAEVELLAGIKLITGVPLYAAMLWVTWLLCRTVFRQPDADTAV